MIPEKLTAEELAKVPEPLRDLYTEREGVFVLDAVPRRVSNNALNTKREAEQRANRIAQDYGGYDPDEVKSAVELKRGLETQELLKKGDVEGLLDRERKKLMAESSKKASEYESKLQQSNAQLAKLLRDDAVLKAAAAAGVRSDALEDVALFAERSLRVVDGRLVDTDEQPVDVTKWVKELTTKKRYLLGESSGGGTGKGDGVQRQTFKPRSQMSAQEKADALKALGSREAFLKLPA